MGLPRTAAGANKNRNYFEPFPSTLNIQQKFSSQNKINPWYPRISYKWGGVKLPREINVDGIPCSEYRRVGNDSTQFQFTKIIMFPQNLILLFLTFRDLFSNHIVITHVRIISFSISFSSRTLRIIPLHFLHHESCLLYSHVWAHLRQGVGT